MVSGDAFACLKDWAVTFVKHRDIAAKKIEAISDAESGFVVRNKDGTSMVCLIMPVLNSQNIAPQLTSIIFTLNNDGNIKAVAASWDKLAANPSLLVVFASPFSQGENKWLVKPHLHNKVCDRKTLLQGLRSMSELVEPVDEAALASKSKR